MDPYILSPQAEIDLYQIASQISQDSEAVAIRFLEAAEKTFVMLSDAPHIGRILEYDEESQAQHRVYCVRHFPNILVLYRVEGRQPQIGRIIHGARDIEAVLADE